MLRATLSSLLARKIRLMLSGIAVILGVAFVSGTFVLTDTMGKVFDVLFADVNKGTAVTVQGTSALGSGNNDREPVPQAVLDKVRTVSGVTEAEGAVFGYAQLVDKKGKAYKTGGAPSFGVSMNPASSQESLRVRQGHAPHGPNEIAIDATTADRAHFKVGDTAKVLLKGPARTVRIVAVVGLDKAPSFAGASLIAFDPASAQQALGTPGTWSGIGIAAAPGVNPTELQQRIEQVLPKGFEALTQQQKIDEDAKDIKDGLSVFNTVLLAFGGIALFVGMFLIFNTFSMLIAQRTRELALMRALGASRRQVTGSVLVEALIVGVLSSVVGFVLGIGVAVLLRKILGALGVELPGGATVIALRTFVVSMLVGVVVTVLAALVPARRAARVAPVQAMRESGPAEDRSLRRRSIIGALLLAGGVAAITAGLSGDGDIKLVGLGAALAFLGVSTLSPLVARPVVGFVGLPFLRLGTPSALGRGNAMRSPRRTAATASALMIGLALVAMVSTFGASVKKSLAEYVGRSLGADYVLHTEQFETFSPVVADRLRKQPDVDLVAAYRFANAKVDGKKVELQGVEAKPLVATLTVKTASGDITSIDRGQMAVSEQAAQSQGLHVGDKVDVVWSRTGNKPMTIGAVYEQNLFAGDYLVGGDVVDKNVTERLLGVVAVTLKPGVSPDQGRKAVDGVAKDFPNLDVEDQAQLVQAQRKQVDGLLNVVTGLLVFSVLIAVLGIINTLALSVIERTRELGLLRAVGLGRRQLRRMIRVESVLIAVYGAILGIVIGECFGWALVKALSDQGIDQFAVPVTRLLLVLVAAALGGVVAAALPARRAARLNVLAAIAEE
ncbi:MAG TPA: FtsX-like permease family protein [Mycobacteriales bacterium]|nr:FtsX-like permease family protein [Mycobacteriales bacterium]